MRAYYRIGILTAAAVFSFAAASPLRAESLDLIAKTISKASGKVKNRQIAILPFPFHDGRQGQSSTIVSEKLLTKIVDRRQFQVVERSLLEKVLAELKLQNSGAVSAESAKKIGQILGVDALLTGTLIDLGKDQVEVNARLIQAESGLVLAAASERMERSWSEELPEPAKPETARGGDSKEKMSVYFHSREWKDPRLEARAAPEGEPVRDADNATVLSNADESPRSGMGGEERMLDAPGALYRDVETGDAAERTQDLRALQIAWDEMNKGNFPSAARTLSSLKRMGPERPGVASLAQLYLSEAQFRQGFYEQAIREAKPVARYHMSPRIRAHAIYILARSQENLGRTLIAAQLYRELVQHYPYESRLIRAAGQRMRAQARR